MAEQIKKLTRRRFLELTAAGVGGAMVLFRRSTSHLAGAEQDRTTPAYLRQFIKTPIINSHVHILSA